MDVLHPHHPLSTLNPNAPIFIPMKSYRTVEDFSDQWWDLVHSSPFFRDYWLQDCFDETSQTAPPLTDIDHLALSDFDAFVDLYLHHQQEEREVEVEVEKKREKELISIGALKWSKPWKAEPLRTVEKAPKIVKSVRVNPRTIHQPR